jgi:hypothetical protein
VCLCRRACVCVREQAEVQPLADGTCGIRLHLKREEGLPPEGPFEAHGCWTRVEGGEFFLTAVAVSRRPSGGVG